MTPAESNSIVFAVLDMIETAKSIFWILGLIGVSFFAWQQTTHEWPLFVLPPWVYLGLVFALMCTGAYMLIHRVCLIPVAHGGDSYEIVEPATGSDLNRGI